MMNLIPTKARSHFDRYYDEIKNRNVFNCKHCNKSLNDNRNTSALVSHMTSYHGDIPLLNKVSIKRKFTEFEVEFTNSNCQKIKASCSSQPYQSKPLKTFMASKIPYPDDSLRKAELVQHVVNFIVKSNQPLSLVEDKWFVAMLSGFDSKLKLPCRQTVMNKLVPDLYESKMELLKSSIEKVKHCSLTCDRWTSSSSTSYLGVTVHFVEDFVLKSYLLTLRQFENSYTADLEDVMEKWNISKKVVNLTAHDATNFKMTITDSAYFECIQCLSYVLNLVVKILMNSKLFKSILHKCRNLVGTFKPSTSLSEKLSTTMKEMNIKEDSLELTTDEGQEDEDCLSGNINLYSESIEDTELIQEISTRWNSTLDMIESVYKMHNAIVEVFNSTFECKEYIHDLLDVNEMSVIEDLIKLLVPLKEATRIVSASDYVPSSTILPVVTYLLEFLHLFSSEINEVETIARQMHDELSERSTAYFKGKIILAASFMDPRYRTLEFIKSAGERDQAIFDAQQYIKSIYKSLSNEQVQKPDPEPAQKISCRPASKFLLCSNSNDSFDNEFQAWDELQSTNTINVELKYYRCVKTYVHETSDPLQFYMQHQTQIPNLARIAKMIFCATASSVPSECVFSAAGRLVPENRSELTHELNEKLIWLNQNDL